MESPGDSTPGIEEHIEQLANRAENVDHELADGVRSLVHRQRAHELVEAFGGLHAEIEHIDVETDPIANPHGAILSTSEDEADGVELELHENAADADATQSQLGSEDGDHGDKEAVSVWTVLFTRPRIKQYFHEGKLHRSLEHRKTSWLELFFDLIFVAIVAKLGNHYTEAPSWARLSDFFVLFAPVWRVMADFNVYNNVFATDDVASSIFIGWTAALVIGMGVTASAALPKGTGNAYIAFYLANRLTYLATYGFFFILFPKFRISLMLSLIAILVPSLLWLAGLLLYDVNYSAMIGCFWAALLLEFGLTAAAEIGIRTWSDSWLQKRTGWAAPEYRIALNIEHTTERQGLFVIVALGEFVVALLFDYEILEFYLYGKAVLALITAMCLQWMYFDGVSKIQQHALRRHTAAGAAWNALHFPFNCFVILAGANAASIVTMEDHGRTSHAKRAESPEYSQLNESLAWSFCGSLAAAYVCLVLISLTHEYNTEYIVLGPIRKGVSLIIVSLFALLPLAWQKLTSLTLMAIVAGANSAWVTFEMFAKIPKPGKGKGKLTFSIV